MLQVNGQPFARLTHDEAVDVLKSSHRLTFVVKYVGKVPHSSLVSNRMVANTNTMITPCSQPSWPKSPGVHVTTSFLKAKDTKKQTRLKIIITMMTTLLCFFSLYSLASSSEATPIDFHNYDIISWFLKI
jgi:hypothetical protein